MTRGAPAALAGLLAGALLSGCGGSPPATDNNSGPVDGSVGGGAPMRTASAPEFRGAPLGLGSWHYQEMGGEAAAAFGPPASEARFIIHCDRQTGQVRFVRAGSISSGAGTMRLVSDRGSITLAARDTHGETPEVEATLPAGSDFIREVVDDHGSRFGVAIDDGKLLVMPDDPAIQRALNGCRTR
ncbi:hypothetical protein [Sphingosinithalassobacter portus]|uniref:hypothetical protein n=1 Tax=Stakelama portus TaxID=2676234 RepID=UPI000D6E377F|nr:hypothetical protein [Sphingosinithalassobacter portus]